MTLKEKRHINENKSKDMSQDEMCTKRFMFCAFNKLMARHRNVTFVGVDREAFATDVYNFLSMKPDELALYENGINETDLEKKGELIIKKIFAEYNL